MTLLKEMDKRWACEVGGSLWVAESGETWLFSSLHPTCGVISNDINFD